MLSTIPDPCLSTTVMPVSNGFTLCRIARKEDVPMAEAQALLEDHCSLMHSRMVASGGPDFDYSDHCDAFWHSFDAYLPPLGSYYLVYNDAGDVVGTAALKRVSETIGEMKHLYVKPEARRNGLGEALVEARIRDAGKMGIKELIADTFAVNTEQPALYDKIGFERVSATEMSATVQLTPELVPFIRFFRMAL